MCQENQDNIRQENSPLAATPAADQETDTLRITVPSQTDAAPDGLKMSVTYMLVQLLAYKQVSAELTQELAAVGDEPGGDFTFVGINESAALGLIGKDVKVMVQCLSGVLAVVNRGQHDCNDSALVAEAIAYANAWLEHKRTDAAPMPGATLILIALVESSNAETIQSRVASYKRQAEAATPFSFAK